MPVVVEIQSQLNVKRFPTTQQATLGTPVFFFQTGRWCANPASHARQHQFDLFSCWTVYWFLAEETCYAY